MTIGQDIGWARAHLGNGRRVRRAGWNGKGMWLALVLGGDRSYPPFRGIEMQDFVAMRTAQGTWVPWLCSQTDFLATDWEAADE